jgi:hypothetical protein
MTENENSPWKRKIKVEKLKITDPKPEEDDQALSCYDDQSSFYIGMLENNSVVCISENSQIKLIAAEKPDNLKDFLEIFAPKARPCKLRISIIVQLASEMGTIIKFI